MHCLYIDIPSTCDDYIITYVWIKLKLFHNIFGNYYFYYSLIVCISIKLKSTIKTIYNIIKVGINNNLFIM